MAASSDTSLAVWSEYEGSLIARGLLAEDARVLVGAARALQAPLGSHGPLFPFLRARLYAEDWQLVLDAVIETQARGPRQEPWSTAWRRLYVEGCPLDHLWAVLWHSFKDPEADPQDFVWLAPAVGLDNVQRIIELQFPRSSAPGTYGPGLGCQALYDNTRRGAKELIRLGAPSMPVLQNLNRCRSVLSRSLRADVDVAAGLQARTVARPSAEALRAIREKLDAAAKLSPEEWETIATDSGFDEGMDELLALDHDVEASVERWFAALEARFASGQVVHDVGGDRFVLQREPFSMRESARRAAPRLAQEPSTALRRLVDRWRENGAPNQTTLEELELQDPLRWLATIGEMAVFAGYDEATGNVKIRDPPQR